MQWFINIIVAICKAYTDQEIAALKAYTAAAILNGANMPVGTVILWFGALEDIPDGWGACNSGDGRPDYRGRFVKCAGSGNPPGDIGGSLTHTHGTGSGLDTGKARTATASSVPPFINLWYIIKL